MATLVQTAVFVLGVIVVSVKLLSVGRLAANNPAIRAMCGAIIAMCVAVIFEEPIITPLINRVLGWEYGYALRHTPAILSFFFLRTAFLCWVWEPGRFRVHRLRVHTTIVVGVLIARWLLAAVAPAGDAEAALNSQWTQAPWTIPAVLLYCLYMSQAVVAIAALAWLWARNVRGERRWTARGLYCIAAGASVFALYLLHKLVFLGLEITAGTPQYNQYPVERLILQIAVVLLFLGLAMPLVATGIPHAVELAKMQRAYRRIGPFWLQLTALYPEVVLVGQAGSMWERLTLRNLSFRLFRRVVECWDVMRQLRPYLDLAVRESARETARAYGLTAEQADDTANAVMIVVAVRTVGAVKNASPLPIDQRAPSPDAAMELPDNIRWWQRVASASSTPLTEALTQRFQQQGKRTKLT
jgi:Family of unknown function (DUF6545)